MVTRPAEIPTLARVRRWWPIPALIGASVAVQQVAFMSRYDVSGHAAEHLTSGSAPFFAFAMIATLLYLTPGARRQAWVVVACLAWFVTTVFVLAGNLHVVNVLVDAGMADVPTSQIVVEGPIEAAHGLADAAPWWGVAASLAMVVALWRGGHVSRRVALGAAVLSVLFPPWMIPGAGVLVLVVARAVAFERGHARENASGRP